MKHRSAGVASAALELALRGREFQVADLQQRVDEPPSRQTVYRVLRQLASDGWVQREGNRWRPSTKAALLSDIDPEDPREATGGFDMDDILEES